MTAQREDAGCAPKAAREVGGTFSGWAVVGEGLCHPIVHVGPIISHWLTSVERYPGGRVGGGSAAPAPLHSDGRKLSSIFSSNKLMDSSSLPLPTPMPAFDFVKETQKG